LLEAIDQIARVSPWRHMTTIRAWRMSIAVTNCVTSGWLSDSRGYRYDALDPQTDRQHCLRMTT